jgi:DNA-binding NarL/FixJ family response regulator
MIKLTNREKELAKYLCLSDLQIAELEHLALTTVKTHVHNILVRTATSTRAGALIELIKRGAIDINEVRTY